LVYDNYNFFVVGFSATERSSDCLVSLVANAKGVGLSFYYGATLPDPANILLGSGNQNRFIRLENAATLAKPGGGGALARCHSPGKDAAALDRQAPHHRQIGGGQATAPPRLAFSYQLSAAGDPASGLSATRRGSGRRRRKPTVSY